jgi:hypothetical protein
MTLPCIAPRVRLTIRNVTRTALENGMLPFMWEVGVDPGLFFDRSTPAVGDQQTLDALLAGAGKAIVLDTK